MTPLKAHMLRIHRAQLEQLIPLLISGEFDYIEYGNQHLAKGDYVHHRLSFINTPAGRQLCLQQYFPGLGDGPGEYYPPSPKSIIAAIDASLDMAVLCSMPKYTSPVVRQKMLAAAKERQRTAEDLKYSSGVRMPPEMLDPPYEEAGAELENTSLTNTVK